MVVDRRVLECTGFRDVTGEEREFIPDDIAHVLEVKAPDGGLEFAADRRTEMGLVSWIESAPDARAERTDIRALAQRAQRETDR